MVTPSYLRLPGRNIWWLPWKSVGSEVETPTEKGAVQGKDEDHIMMGTGLIIHSPIY